MKKNYIFISLLIISNIILGSLLAKFYFEKNNKNQNTLLKNNYEEKYQTISLDEIKNHFNKKLSLPAGKLIITIDDFKKNVYYGSFGENPKDCKPNNFCGSTPFYLRKNEAGIIISQETNGEDACDVLNDKGFDTDTIKSMGVGCYIKK